MFTPENANKIIKNLRKLSLEIHYKKHHGFAIRVGQLGKTEPLICSKIHNIKNKKEAVATICEVLKWAERIYRENKGDKTKKRSVNKLIPQIERAFGVEVDQVSTSDFKI
jgi:hypothetical protein